MNYKEIVKELENLEINDVSSALKGLLLGRFRTVLEDYDDVNSHKIVFNTDMDIDNAVYYLDNKINDVMEDYFDRYVELEETTKKKKKSCDEQCL